MSVIRTPPPPIDPAGDESEHDESSNLFDDKSDRKIAEFSAASNKKLECIFRQCDQVHAKVQRVQISLNTARFVVTHAQLKTYRRNLDAAYGEYSGLHTKLMELVETQADIHNAGKVYTEFEDRFNLVYTAIEELIMQHETTPANAQESKTQVVIQQQPLKVPIPTFDGEYANWPKFKAIFQDLMARSTDSDAVKLYHLDKALVQNAAGVLDAKVITEGNYEQAWTILSERYENKRVIVESHIRGLLSLQKMTSESHKELRRLLDECTRHVESLKYLKQEFLGISELFVVYLLTSALDKPTRKAWESHQKRGELPKYDSTITFLKGRCQILENCESSFPASSAPPSNSKSQAKSDAPKAHTVSTMSASKESCEFCKGPHFNFQCNTLSTMEFDKRMEKVRATGVCFNCLRKGHSSKDCQSPRSCRKCGKRHHTQLHNDESKVAESTNTASTQESEDVTESDDEQQNQEQTTATAWFTHHVQSPKTVLLLTAVANATDSRNQLLPCRVLLDCGSQVNFVSEDYARRLGLRLQQVTVPIRGINDVQTIARHKVQIQLQSRCSDFKQSIECLVTPAVTGDIPSSDINVTDWSIPSGVCLADPEFYKSAKVDVLLGAELFFELMRPGCIQLADDLPELRETKLGWIVSGVLNEPPVSQAHLHSHTACVAKAGHPTRQSRELGKIPHETSPVTNYEKLIRKVKLPEHRKESRSQPSRRTAIQLEPRKVLLPSSTSAKSRKVDASAKSPPKSLRTKDIQQRRLPEHRAVAVSLHTDPRRRSPNNPCYPEPSELPTNQVVHSNIANTRPAAVVSASSGHPFPLSQSTSELRYSQLAGAAFSESHSRIGNQVPVLIEIQP